MGHIYPYQREGKKVYEMKPEKEKEIIDLGDGCSIEFDIGGNIKILKGCEGKEINPIEVAMLYRITQDFRKEML